MKSSYSMPKKLAQDYYEDPFFKALANLEIENMRTFGHYVGTPLMLLSNDVLGDVEKLDAYARLASDQAKIMGTQGMKDLARTIQNEVVYRHINGDPSPEVRQHLKWRLEEQREYKSPGEGSKILEIDERLKYFIEDPFKKNSHNIDKLPDTERRFKGPFGDGRKKK